MSLNLVITLDSSRLLQHRGCRRACGAVGVQLLQDSISQSLRTANCAHRRLRRSRLCFVSGADAAPFKSPDHFSRAMKTLFASFFLTFPRPDAELCWYLQTYQAPDSSAGWRNSAQRTQTLESVRISGEQLGRSLLPKAQALRYWCVSTEQWEELAVFHVMLELIYLTLHPTRTVGTLLVSLQQNPGSEGANPADHPQNHRHTPLEKPCDDFPSSLQPCKR